MKKILGLDLGTNSIGWALVNEAESEIEKSSIIKLGVRVNPLTVDEQQNFDKGKSITTNADRTLKRSMRRNLQRYKLRRENLIEILKENSFISEETKLSENGNNTTFETYRLRAKAATEEVSLEQFARILLMINKKRGYKSSRKAKSQDEGKLIDGMDIAKKLYDENMTPGKLAYQLLKEGKKYVPDFYRSDLQAEFDTIFDKQVSFYPDFLSIQLKEELRGKKRDAVWAICAKAFKEKGFELVGIKRQGNTAEQKTENYAWRVKGLTDKLELEQLVIVLQQINIQLNSSSGYLGAISDRSKELYFNKQTVGQYLMSQLDKNPNASLTNQVFYRQDYLDEFNTLWETQARFHTELTNELKAEIRDIVIFYQRRLKSQKGLISFCEFESRQIEVEIDGKKKIKTIGLKVCPKSSPVFQEFKIWQKLNDIEIFPASEKKKKYKPNATKLNQEQKEILYTELSIKKELKKNQVLELLNLEEFDMNFNVIDGNRTQAILLEKYQEIIELSRPEIDIKKPANEILQSINEIFSALGYNTDILYFDSEISIDEQPMYRLWHLLYSFEEDDSNAGNEKLVNKLINDYGFDKNSAIILANTTFQEDYGSLSAKAIRKILPYLKEGNTYDVACVYAGYGKHSKNSLTREEIDKKVYKNKLDILPKNSLRNPVVEKILNQMVNVINAIIYGVVDRNGNIIDEPLLKEPLDEIRIELSRELKKNANERILLADNVNTNTDGIKKINDILKDEFGIINPSRKDVIRYKLWKELAPIGYKTLYSNEEISPAKLFSKEIDIEHIIPQSRLFDDSLSNKTLEFKSINIDKGNKTAFDYVREKYGDSGLNDYLERIISVFGTKTIKSVNKLTKKIETKSETFDNLKREYIKSLKKKESKDKWENLSNRDKNLIIITKYYSGKLGKLIMTEKDIPDGFINRDLANTQYITKYAKTMLGDLVKSVVSTTGSITDRLRDDWQLVDVMKEINSPKYEKLGLVENEEYIDYETGEIRYVKKIKNWTKRNDHRHHAMDALTVAFTKRQFVQYLNNLNARRPVEEQGIANTEKEEHDNFAITTEDMVLNTRDVLGIEKNYLYRDQRNKLRFNPPMPLYEFRAETKKHLENTLISIKAKNKVTTININTTKKKSCTNKKRQLTPRGQLHLETIYGSNQQYVTKPEKIGAGFNEEQINKVAKKAYREALLKRLQEFENDPKKAFTGKNSLEKNPIWLDALHTAQVPEKVKTVSMEIIYTIRKEISPDLKIEKVVDAKVKQILQARLNEFSNDSKKAFSNLDENPIWLNKDKGIAIKRVTITGISSAEALHYKKDNEGTYILDDKGNKQPVDFVNTGNNHHVAIYRDEKGNLQENVISFFEATERINQGLPIINKDYRNTEGWEFLFSMKQNEYFVFPNETTGFNPNEIDLLNPENYSLISPNLFRVQKFSFKNYVFRHHLETSVADFSSQLKKVTWTDFRSSKGLDSIIKVRINHIGQIVSVGEY